jgi:hypothetical protein
MPIQGTRRLAKEIESIFERRSAPLTTTSTAHLAEDGLGKHQAVFGILVYRL